MVLIGKLEISAQSALRDTELGDKILRTLYSEAKDTTVTASKDCHHLGKSCVYIAENVVQLRKERERLDREKVTKV